MLAHATGNISPRRETVRRDSDEAALFTICRRLTQAFTRPPRRVNSSLNLDPHGGHALSTVVRPDVHLYVSSSLGYPTPLISTAHMPEFNLVDWVAFGIVVYGGGVAAAAFVRHRRRAGREGPTGRLGSRAVFFAVGAAVGYITAANVGSFGFGGVFVLPVVLLAMWFLFGPFLTAVESAVHTVEGWLDRVRARIWGERRYYTLRYHLSQRWRRWRRQENDNT